MRVGVLGLYNSGKTFILNRLSGLALPSSKRFATRGISFRRASLGGCLPAVLLDTEGSLSPVHIRQELAMAERQENEELLERLMVRLSDYLIYVVDDFTSVDQRAVHRLVRRLAERSPVGTGTVGFPELIVVHNLRTVADATALNHIWAAQVTLSLWPPPPPSLASCI